MTRHYYFDATPLICWADARIAMPTPYDTKVAAVVQTLIDGPDTTALSEVTLLEVHSKVCDHWRDTGRPGHDQPWADGSVENLMRWMQTGTLEVLALPPKLAEMAMVNVEEVTRTTGLKLRAWDAAHIFHAVNWSRLLGEKVTLVTSDGDYARVINAVPALQDHLDLHDPGL